MENNSHNEIILKQISENTINLTQKLHFNFVRDINKFTKLSEIRMNFLTKINEILVFHDKNNLPISETQEIYYSLNDTNYEPIIDEVKYNKVDKVDYDNSSISSNIRDMRIDKMSYKEHLIFNDYSYAKSHYEKEHPFKSSKELEQNVLKKTISEESQEIKRKITKKNTGMLKKFSQNTISILFAEKSIYIILN